MLQSLLPKIVDSNAFRSGLALLNSIPLPYGLLPVKVHGHRMFAKSLDRYLALWLWKLNLLDSFQLTLLHEHCRPGMSVVDIGANIGFYSLMLARWVGTTGHIWAFEPDPLNFQILQRNISKNSYRNITAIKLGVACQPQQGHLYLSASHHGDHRIYPYGRHRSKIEVAITSLDAFFSDEEKIDLIKMDIQGAEGLALAGMKRVLQSNPGLLLFMEFCPQALRRARCDPQDVLETLRALGFVLYDLDEPTRQASEIDNVADFMAAFSKKKYTNLLAKGPLKEPSWK